MKEVKLLAVHHRYEIIGYGKDYDECEKICAKHCKEISGGKISFDRKRVIESFDNNGDEEFTIIYQYNTLYLEMFFCTSKLEI